MKTKVKIQVTNAEGKEVTLTMENDNELNEEIALVIEGKTYVAQGEELYRAAKKTWRG